MRVLPHTRGAPRTTPQRAGHAPKKSLGQNFLTDHNLIRKLLDAADLEPGETILEIGPGTGTLKVDGKAVATRTMAKTLPMILQWDESFDVGSDTLTGVNDADYKPPFRFTGNLNKLTIKLDRPKLSPEEIRSLEAAMRTKAVSE